MNYLTEHNIFIFLVQIFLLLGLSRVFGEILRFWKQPTLTAEIFVGVLLGPTILGRFFPALHQGIFPDEREQFDGAMITLKAERESNLSGMQTHYVCLEPEVFEALLQFAMAAGWLKKGQELK